MASKALKGLTIKIGADMSDLYASLDKIDKQSRSLSGELGQINKLLKLDPKNTELLAQKQKVLSEAIGNTEKKLDTLREAEKQAQEQFKKGEISEAQYRALQREIIETEKKLDRYKAAAKETAETQKKLADGAEDVAEELEDQADAAREADQANDNLDDSANALAAGGLAALAAAAAAVVAGIVAMAEESREYRTEMGKLNVAFEDAGHTAEAAQKTYETLQGVLGETEQAVEAANHLAKLCDTEEELAAMTEAAIGVYAVFGASLPIEGLAEAANETARVGQLTGPLTDAINWAAEAGADFGVVLKDNIDFTELSAKELKRLTKSQREEYEARKAQHDEIAAYNKRVEEATSAEDKFNIALENCSNEQERQQLITDTLTALYGDAAKQYKATNKEVIRANEATEKWNKAVAAIGKEVEPVVTDLKELGATILEEAADPLEDVADYIRKTVLPAIRDIGAWVKKNLPLVKSLLIGAATAMVAFKVATIATTVAQKGLKGALMATAVAQKALNLVQAATPWGLIAAGVAGVVVALAALSTAMEDAKRPADVLTEEERELMEAADEAAEAFRDQKKATDEALKGITSQMGYVSDLAEELQGLAGASGEVQEKDRERAQFILNELNEALGTEYSMVDGIIQKYDELKTSIDEVIQAKLANSLLEASNADYVTAIQEQANALENLNLEEKDYQQQLAITQQAEADYLAALEDVQEAIESGEVDAVHAANTRLALADKNLKEEQALLEEKKASYDDAAVAYGEYYNTIANYEEAQAAALSGNYQKAIDILSKKGGAYNTYSEKVDKATAQVLDSLYKEAVDAGLEAERTRRNFENGVEGYTEEMVAEAEKAYADALDAFANAYADAEGVGEDLGDGLSGGMENKRSSLLSKARSLVTGIINAMREEADSHSPARKTIAFGEDVGAGAEIGIENKTADVKRAASRQAAAVLDAYSEHEIAGQRALRNVAEQHAANYNPGSIEVTSPHGPVLEKILTAIEKGQVLTLDGETLVGATAGKMDTALGRRRVLASRGAI